MSLPQPAPQIISELQVRRWGVTRGKNPSGATMRRTQRVNKPIECNRLLSSRVKVTVIQNDDIGTVVKVGLIEALGIKPRHTQAMLPGN